MSFNNGWLCKECGPVKESKKRTINKVQWDCCKVCEGIVTKWERPLKERIGRCSNCGHGGFRQRMGKGALKGVLIRICKNEACKQADNPDTGEIYTNMS